MDIQSLSSLKKDFAAQWVGEELVIVPLKNNVAEMDGMFTLNDVAAFIWEKAGPGCSFDDMKNALTLEFDVDEQTAITDIQEFLQELSQHFKAA